MTTQNLTELYQSQRNRPQYYSSTDHILYEVSVPWNNNGTSVNFSSTVAEFNETRSAPILNKPEDYYASVTRFAIDGSNIPIQICPVLTYSQGNTATNGYSAYGITANYNITPYSVTIGFSGTTGTTLSQQYLEYTPINPNMTKPTSVTSTTTPVRADYADYYGVFSYETFVNMFNTAFERAFNNAFGPGGNTMTGSTYAPFMAFDSATQLFSIYVPTTYLTSNLKIYMNIPAEQLFSSSFYENYNGASSPFGSVNEIIIEDDVLKYVTIDGIDYLKITQEFVTTTKFNSIKQLLITSNLPSRAQLTPNIATNSSNIIQTANNSKPILTDFNITNQQGSDFRNQIVYNPTAEYRRIDLLGSSPLYNINMSFYWVDNYQNVYPILIPYGSSINVLVLFERKYK
jgi:hypothetical protein